MTVWREHLFAAISRSAGSLVAHFRRPENAVVDWGARVQI
jgi:K+ transporter